MRGAADLSAGPLGSQTGAEKSLHSLRVRAAIETPSQSGAMSAGVENGANPRRRRMTATSRFLPVSCEYIRPADRLKGAKYKHAAGFHSRQIKLSSRDFLTHVSLLEKLPKVSFLACDNPRHQGNNQLHSTANMRCSLLAQLADYSNETL